MYLRTTVIECYIVLSLCHEYLSKIRTGTLKNMKKNLSILSLPLITFFAVSAQTNNETINIGMVGNDVATATEPQVKLPADIFSVPRKPSGNSNTATPLNSNVITSPMPLDKSLLEPVIISKPLTGTAANIAKLTQYGSVHWQGLDNRLRSPNRVRKLYDSFNYRPLWVKSSRVTPLAEQVIQAIMKAGEHALRPELYHSNAISSVRAGLRIAEPEKFDVLLTDAFISYKSHLTNGIIDPKQQFSTWNTPPQSIDFAAIYEKASRRGNIENVFRINDKYYQALQAAYLSELGQPGGKKITKVPAKKSLFPGTKGKSVTRLRERLGLPTDSNVYDESVKNAVRDYQKQNGLSADGIAGKRTLRHMNRKSGGGNHIEKLAINMERYRWGNVPNSGNYVWVNIPAYKMAVRNGNKSVFKSNVIVGRSSRQTPVFQDTMEHVVLAPYWNVPKTIFSEDKLPKLQKNANALGKTIQVINKSTGKVVKASSVNWKNGGTGYRLRQLPGKTNALGRVKFLFPNRHAIYLHDTPNRKLFKKSRRAFSSGCIRVEKADDLALFLLNDRGYDDARYKKESRKSKEKWINLKGDKRYPVFLNYYTAWADDNGKVHYNSDIYGYDKALINLYKQAISN